MFHLLWDIFYFYVLPTYAMVQKRDVTDTGFRLTGGGSLNTESAKKKENDEITCDAKKVLLTGGPNDLLEQLNR